MVLLCQFYSLLHRHFLLSFRRKGQHNSQQQKEEQELFGRETAFPYHCIAYNLIENRNNKQCQYSRYNQNYSSQRTLHFGAGRGGNGHRNKSQGSNQSCQENRPQQMSGSTGNHPSGGKSIHSFFSYVIKVINH